MVFSTLQQSFAFHSSPDAFITTRIPPPATSNVSTNTTESDRRDVFSQGIARAQILNRDVHIVSDYKTCQQILQSDSTSSATFAAGPAYHELMADFFPPPNILLQDGAEHHRNKGKWIDQVSRLPEDAEALIRSTTQAFIQEHFSPDTSLDLYDTLKSLAWELLLGVFLGLDPSTTQYDRVEKAQETLLRGQFSLFPVSVRMPFWQSARSKGIKARKELQGMLQEHFQTLSQNVDDSKCPLFDRHTEVDAEEMASHALLFTSSIANKALASLLTASVMNVFLMPVSNPNTPLPATTETLSHLLSTHQPPVQTQLLSSILRETERLSPPVIGVMRRVTQDTSLQVDRSDPHSLPKGHDVWLYFTSASRDPQVFNQADEFVFDRFMSSSADGLGLSQPSTPHPPPSSTDDDTRRDPSPSNHLITDTPVQPLAFGSGPKSCLGSSVARRMVAVVLQEMVSAGLTMRIQGVVPNGVRRWLGWSRLDPGMTGGGTRDEESKDETGEDKEEDWARGMKQLPCQRPRMAIRVVVGRIEGG